MLAVGDRVAPASVYPMSFEAATLHELAAERPILLFFYLFDRLESRGEGKKEVAPPPPEGGVPPAGPSSTDVPPEPVGGH